MNLKTKIREGIIAKMMFFILLAIAWMPEERKEKVRKLVSDETGQIALVILVIIIIVSIIVIAYLLGFIGGAKA